MENGKRKSEKEKDLRLAPEERHVPFVNDEIYLESKL